MSAYGFSKDSAGAVKVAPSGAALDAFGRQRVSEVTSLLDVKQMADKQPLLIDEEIGGSATSTHSTTNSSTSIATTADTEFVIRQTFQRPPYLAGKGQQFFFTFSGFNAETSITKRVGCFHSNTTTPFNSTLDGIWLESDSTAISLEIYKSGTETVSVTQANWDDPMDGSGPSGVTIDWTKSQIMEIDYEWLGVGSVRLCFVINGTLYVAHTYNHVNANTSTYMTNPNQPIRYEIRQSGAGSGSLECICATAGTEGSVNVLGKPHNSSNENTVVTATAAGTKYPILAVRQKSAQPNVWAAFDHFDLLVTTADDVYWEIHVNPTLTGGSLSYSDITDSGMQEAVGNGTITVSADGWVIDSGFASGGAGSSASMPASGNRNSAFHPGVAIDGTRDEVVLVVTPVSASASADCSGIIHWLEVD